MEKCFRLGMFPKLQSNNRKLDSFLLERNITFQFHEKTPNGFPTQFITLGNDKVRSMCGFEKFQVEEVAKIASNGSSFKKIKNDPKQS